MGKSAPTLADLKAGNLPEADRQVAADAFNAAKTLCAATVERINEWEAEATELFDRLPDMSLPEVEAYIAENPPSPGAIAWLIFVSQDKFKSDQGKSGAKGRAARTNRIKADMQQLARDKVPPSGQWKSRRQAELALLDDFTSHEDFKTYGMSKAQAQTTLGGYLKEMPDADTLFAGKRSTSTGKGGTSAR